MDRRHRDKTPLRPGLRSGSKTRREREKEIDKRRESVDSAKEYGTPGDGSGSETSGGSQGSGPETQTLAHNERVRKERAERLKAGVYGKSKNTARRLALRECKDVISRELPEVAQIIRDTHLTSSSSSNSSPPRICPGELRPEERKEREAEGGERKTMAVDDAPGDQYWDGNVGEAAEALVNAAIARRDVWTQSEEELVSGVLLGVSEGSFFNHVIAVGANRGLNDDYGPSVLRGEDPRPRMKEGEDKKGRTKGEWRRTEAGGAGPSSPRREEGRRVSLSSAAAALARKMAGGNLQYHRVRGFVASGNLNIIVRLFVPD